jgi:hypothetical protein
MSRPVTSSARPSTSNWAARVLEHQITIECSRRSSLSCSVNDAVNVLPCATCAYLNGGPSHLCCLTRTTLGFRPPPDYGSGGRRTPWSLHVARAAAGPGGAWRGGTVGGRPCRAYSSCHPRPWRELCQRTGGLPMDRARTLAVVSAGQLGAGVAGMVVALRRHGQPDAIARDTLFKGTALSARCPRWSPRQRWLPSWPVDRVGPRRGGWASLASPWWPATWASGWCGNGFAHLVGTPWSRP